MGNSLNVGLRTGYLSVRTAGSTSDRRGMEARRINGHTYLLTCLLTYLLIVSLVIVDHMQVA